jgi:hypothetical protein
MKASIAVALAALVSMLAIPGSAAAPPNDQVARLQREVATLKNKVKQLQQENRNLRRFVGRLDRASTGMVRHIASVDPCQITRANNDQPPGPTFGSEFHGNGLIWVGLWRSNVVVQDPRSDGSIDAKFGWWRGVAGTLRIEGRRLDGPAPPLHANIPTGYGDSGFQATGIIFPTAGCWEVTGRVSDASLTFVTLVIASVRP